ncbi:hypothetical protein QEH56_04315 [Pelagicoccus enzymogenes]|uniref:hypothetical protein n=1 Tax=Pelagicoccus enzymogenes TaxID=2773457 RepID=UPI00280D2D75|nr:hypothetical protein [Pelagicoccus enzymogenes]MDQ8197356.1 hypothetical protein [Pelagicoccus enzymogenes]
MSRVRILRVSLLSLLLPLFLPSSRADAEADVVNQAINALDHFMQAGMENDARRGAGLLKDFDTNARRAEYDTQLLYRRQGELLSNYVSISSDLYGYEIREVLGVTSVRLEGGIETLAGVTAEFKARVVYQKKRWRIANLEID